MAAVIKNGKPAAGRHSSIQLASENGSPSRKVAFWHQIDRPNSQNWNKSFPYQFMVLKRTANGGYQRVPGWNFTLPIPPQALQMDMPFPVEGQVTLGGYIEQWGKFAPRPLQFSGTTGFLPLRGSAPPLQQFNAAEAIFAGTLQAASTAQRAISDFKQDVQPGAAPSNLIKQSDINDKDPIGLTTGYYQFRLLEQFLERYQDVKSTTEGETLRLAFAVWKSEAVYLVTPHNFSLRRAVPDVYEYQYSFQGRAFKRISLDAVPHAEERLTPIVRNPDALTRALKAINDARRVIYAARSALTAVVGDVTDLVLNPLREVCLFIKDVIGTVVAMGDLPKAVIRAAKSAVVELASVRDTAQGVVPAFQRQSQEDAREWDELKALGAALAKGETGSGDLSSTASALNADPAHRIFDAPEDHFEFFDSISPGDLNLSPVTVDAIVRERERVQGLARSDFERLRDQVLTFSAAYADAIGMGDDVFNGLYGRMAPQQVREATDDDEDVLFALNDVALQLDHLAASGDIDRMAVSSLEYVAGLASAAGIAFTVPRSKFAVPFPYGATMERLAERYLGDPDRWLEIATLNGLRTPYVDETGFTLSFITNGSGNQITIADPGALRVGQFANVYSSTRPRLKVRIIRIDRVSASLTTVTVDRDVSAYKLSDGAGLHTFLPDTVNSRMAIYIPSSKQASEDDYHTKGIPGVDEFDPLIKVAGMDLLLTPRGDLVITPDGDTPLAVGLTSIVQQVRIALSVPRGTLLHHPEYGLDVPVGTNTADLDPQDLVQAARDMFGDDPTFDGVQSVAVQKTGPTATLAVNVAVAGYDKLIPVGLEVS